MPPSRATSSPKWLDEQPERRLRRAAAAASDTCSFDPRPHACGRAMCPRASPPPPSPRPAATSAPDRSPTPARATSSATGRRGRPRAGRRRPGREPVHVASHDHPPVGEERRRLRGVDQRRRSRSRRPPSSSTTSERSPSPTRASTRSADRVPHERRVVAPHEVHGHRVDLRRASARGGVTPPPGRPRSCPRPGGHPARRGPAGSGTRGPTPSAWAAWVASRRSVTSVPSRWPRNRLLDADSNTG